MPSLDACELEKHPYLVGVQFHPEFRSRPVGRRPVRASPRGGGQTDGPLVGGELIHGADTNTTHVLLVQYHPELRFRPALGERRMHFDMHDCTTA